MRIQFIFQSSVYKKHYKSMAESYKHRFIGAPLKCVSTWQQYRLKGRKND